MTATNEQIIEEAHRRAAGDAAWGARPVEHFIIEVTREGWKPPEPVDPDVLAYREWASTQPGAWKEAQGALDQLANGMFARAYLAGARMAREQEQERAKVLVEYVRGRLLVDLKAQIALKAYERAAR
jgi:hypothetical protein